MTPAEWFDQFPALKPGMDKPGMEWPDDSKWCPRHWAP